MRFFSFKYICLLVLGLSSTAALHANYEYNNNESCCLSRSYECSCEPLYCGAWGVQFDVGVRPTIWRGRHNFFSLQNANGITGVTALGDLPKFSSLYHTPWQIGGQLSYAFSTNCNVFAEVHYAQARRKQNDFSTAVANDLFINLSKYKLIDAYLGARYYTDRWCNKVAFFIGGKIGLVHHKSIHSLSSLTGICCSCFSPDSFFRSNTSIAGGLNLGLDICYAGNWSFVVTGEVIASRGPKSVGTIMLSASDSANLNGATSLIIQDKVKTEIAFPVTFGIKYNF